MPELTFTLVQKAKKAGGDKYQCDSIETFVIYIPQTISRKDGEVRDELAINIK